MKKKVAIIAEDPYDSLAIQNLLKKKFGDKFSFHTPIKNKTGGQLDSIETMRKQLAIECGDNQFDIILFMRDTDGIVSDKAKTKKRKDWFNSLKKSVKAQTLLLLNIWEIEALIFADLTPFNKKYKCNIKECNNTEYIVDPKRILRSKSNYKFGEKDNPAIFNLLDLNKIEQKCLTFKKFLVNLQSAI